MSQLPEELLKRLPAKRRAEVVGHVVGAFESETAAVLLRTSPRSEHFLLYALGVGLALVLLLAAFVKLDRVVVGTGRIVPVGGMLYISPLDSGVVREIRVKSGDVVKKGQVLATLDPTFTQADRGQLEQKLASDQAALARLEAEVAGRSYAPRARDVSSVLQASIGDKKLREYRASLADFDARIRSVESQVSQYDGDVVEFRKRLQLAEEVEKLYAPLLVKGYVSKLQGMQAADARAEANRLLSDAGHQAASTRQNLHALRQQRSAFEHKWAIDASDELVALRSETEATRRSLQKAVRLNELVSLNAPADAVVLKVGRASVGYVAASAANMVNEPLFTLVPLDVPVEVELHVMAKDIGFIRAGDRVVLKIDAYTFLRHGSAEGRIASISEGTFTTDDTSAVQPYFRVRVQVTATKLHNVPRDFRLIPGMTLQGDIMVGSRTILSYLVEGALRTGSEAMREAQ